MEEEKYDVKECCKACCLASCGCLITVIAIGLGALGIAKIVMGAIHLHDCTIEDLIPIWLIVSGCAPVLFSCFRGQNNAAGENSFDLAGAICGAIAFLFNLAWLICGSVWVYPNFGTIIADDFMPCTPKVTSNCTQGNCDKSLITFAFAMVTVDWVLMCILIINLGLYIVNKFM
ncbi:uncharacterized protein LOC132760164 [Ruditapes philippinarum]|uniref:uncharacterized protein LOC132760164 n=1 Tax=Ruditapes philippinarum TaxID=129788 RepID=UPI00295BD8BD|nr:uncharacterized protein LOC132760164 [Ruditapes philippinarum]